VGAPDSGVTAPWCWAQKVSLAVSLVLEESGAMRLEFTLDCTDLDQTAEFWRAATGFLVEGMIPGRYISLSGHGVALTLQYVEEPKTTKNRMHLDLLVMEDLELEVHRLENLGASRVTPTARQEFGQTWFVLADPEGNEFCVARDQH
jgi:predicted enzyme related to lactoylglutathione lyase